MTTFQSEIKPAENGTRPFRIVFHNCTGTPATHMETDPGTPNRAFHHGNYFPGAETDAETMIDALTDYLARCKKYGLKP